MAIEAERVVVTLEAQTTAATAAVKNFDKSFDGAMSNVERSAAQAEGSVRNSVTRMGDTAVRTAGQIKFATRDLGFQISDIGVQLASGTSPFLIIAQQGPQTAQALQLISEAGAGLGTVLRSLALPGILAVVSALYGIISAHERAADATKLHKVAADALKEAEDRLASSTADEAHQTELGIRADIAKTNALRQREIQTRKTLLAQLELAKGDLALGGQPGISIMGVQSGNPAAAAAAATIKELNAKIAEQDAKISGADKSVAAGQGELVMRHVAAATDKATAAAQRYADAIDVLQHKFQSGRFGDPNSGAAQAELNRRATAITKQRDAELDAAKATDKHTRANHEGADASKAAEKALLDQVRALDELSSKLNSLVGELEPAQAAAAGLAIDMGTIEHARLGGLIDDSRALTLSLEASARYAKQIQDVGDKQFGAMFGPELDQYKNITSLSGEHEQAKEDSAAQDQAKRHAEDQIRDLANLYDDLFTGGTQNVWDDFKRMGLRAIAEIAARWTAANLLNSGGEKDILKIGAQVISNLGGHAGGGYAAPHSISRVNESSGGVELLRMGPQGGEVIPLGQQRAATPQGGTTIIHAPQFNLRGAVVTRELYADMQRISDTSAARAAAASYHQSMKDAPSAVRRASRFGG